MNRKKRVEMLVRVLLMPFIRPEFISEDLLEKKIIAYNKMQIDSNKKSKNEYAKSEKSLNNFMNSFIETDRLRELSLLLEMFYPEKELSDNFDINNGTLDGYYIDTILQIAGEFITLRDGVVSIRMWQDTQKDKLFRGDIGLYKVELWSEISRTITPDVLISAFFVANGIDNINHLYQIRENISLSDSVLDRYLKQGVAETHLHFSAGINYLSVWEIVSDISVLERRKRINRLQKIQQTELKNRDNNLVIAAYLRLIFAKFLEESSESDICEYYEDYTNGIEIQILLYLLNNNDISLLKNNLINKLDKSFDFSKHLQNVFSISWKENTFDILQKGPYGKYSYLGTSAEIILLYKSFLHIKKHPEHKNFRRIFLHYLRIKSDYFSDKIQTIGKNGLTFFREYFNRATSVIKGEKKNHLIAYNAIFRSLCYSQNIQKLEIKISPIMFDKFNNLQTSRFNINKGKLLLVKQLLLIFETYLNVLKEAKTTFAVNDQKLETYPTLGVVFHFIKKDVNHPPANVCWVTNKEYIDSSDYVEAIRQESILFLTCLHELRLEIPFLSEYVVGIDAASEENYSEPWIYAPVFREARNRFTTLPIQLQTKNYIQNLGLTYHVGEDYHHVVSGLRHVDEVVSYFGYKSGDRIGHGLALYVDIKSWLENNEVVALPNIEYLENMLWLWHLCSLHTDVLSQYTLKLEQEIMEQAKKIYTNIKGINPYVLWETYTRKFLRLEDTFCDSMKSCYFQNSQNTEIGYCKLAQVYPSQLSFCALFHEKICLQNKDVDFNQEAVWDSDKLLLTYYCPIYIQHYQKPMLIHNSSKNLEYYELIQQILREKIQKAGIYIETNPTSNMIIGDIESLYNYPITNLNNKPFVQKGNSIMLSINSDDPLIFSTNVENEYSMIYLMLLNHGYSTEDVLKWIEKVRVYGIKSSFIRQAKEICVQENEIEKIINELYKQSLLN